MSVKVQRLRALVNERLTAAAEEIFALFERTIVEYEEEMCRSEEENKRKQQLLDSLLKPQVLLHRTDVQVQKVSHEDPGPSLEQVTNTQLPQIKPESKEWSISQESKCHTFLSLTPLSTENKDVLPLLRQTQQDGEGTKRKDAGGLQSDHEDERTEHSSDADDDWTRSLELSEFEEVEMEDSDAAQTRDGGRGKQKHRRSLKSCCIKLKNKTPGSYARANYRSFKCLRCDKCYQCEADLVKHSRIHLQTKPFSCSDCAATFTRKDSLKTHMGLHTGQRAFTCGICEQGFNRRLHLALHLAVHHAADQTLSCSFCEQSFNTRNDQRSHLMTLHRKELYQIFS